MRTFVIVLRLLPFALSFRRDFRRWLIAGAPLTRSAALHQHRAERVASTLAALGPTFVKLAQVFAARADLIPEPYVGKLATLFDRVPAAPFPTVAKLLHDSFGRPHYELFDQFEIVPVAAGSLGLVYEARYGGERVAVKVLRPGVERLVARDLHAARRITNFIRRRWPNPHVRNFGIALDEFALRIGDEMDFRLEAENGRQIAATFAGDARVIVPRVIPQLTRQRVLVMQYVDGRRVNDIGALVASGKIDAPEMLRTVIELYARMMLVDGLFHADPHPGNLLIREDGAIVLLDFGMVVRVPREMRARLIRTVLSAVRRDAAGVADGFHELGLVEPGARREQIVRLVDTLLTLAYAGGPPADAMRALADEVMATLYDWPIVLTGEMVYFARAAALIEGIGMRWVPEFNSIAFASPVVLRMRREVLAALGDSGGLAAEDWAAALGTLAGQAAKVVSAAGRDFVALLGTGLALLADQNAALQARQRHPARLTASATAPAPANSERAPALKPGGTAAA